MDNPEKLATYGTQDTRRRQTKQKHNIICVGNHYAQTNTNTNNVNKILAVLQTIGV
jgi:hypothetical protein